MPWYKDAIFYEVYLRAFADGNGDGCGDFRGLTQKLDYFSALGVDCLWLLPMYASPLVDGGYDISDFYQILPDYGSIDDFKTFLDEAHNRGIKVIADLVLNHTSDQHPWFKAARSSRSSPYRDYYIWSDTDKGFSEARIIFVDTQKSNWQYDPQAGQYYFHRFFPEQPDLNYDNPAVQKEILNIIHYWLDLGLDGFRADAVPYLYKREKTNCENLPETHQFLKLLRKSVDEHFQNRILLAEANQWPQDVRPYFGEGDEVQMAFHFPLMPRIFKALAESDSTPIVDILHETPPIPESCQWCNFLRNHDELTLEMVTPEDRDFLWEYYAPDPRMRLNLGIRRRLAPLLNGDRRKIELAYSILFTLPGAPIIYYGDEIGMGDNIALPDRDGVRTPMQWENTVNGGFSEAPPENLYIPPITDEHYGYQRVNVADQRASLHSLWHTIRWMIACRKGHHVFGKGDFEFLQPDNQAILAFIRTYDNEVLVAVHNLSGQTERVDIDFNRWTGRTVREMMSKKHFSITANIPYQITLLPYEYLWLMIEPDNPSV